MKTLILLLLLSVNTIAQVIYQDTVLTGYTLDFIEEATDRGYNISPQLYARLVSVELSPLTYPNLGLYTHYNKTIRISPYVLIDTTLVRLTIYHELGHVLKLGAPHSCNACSDIMSATQYKSICYYKNKATMKKELDKLFKWIYND